MVQYRYYEVPVCVLANGMQYSIPVHEFGKGKKPIFVITAVVHGDEQLGVEALRQLAEKLRNTEVNGTVQLIPCVNSLAFATYSRNANLDGKDLNRNLPGDIEGNFTEKLAAVLDSEILSKADILIDVHGGGRECVVDYTYVVNDLEFAKASLGHILYTPPEMATVEGHVDAMCKKRNVPVVTLEAGGFDNTSFYLQKLLHALENMLRYKGMIPGKAIKSTEKIYVVKSYSYVPPRHGGLYVPAYGTEYIGKVIEGKGVVLGRTYNPKTFELLEELKTPFKRNLMILMRAATGRLVPGDWSYMIADLDKAEEI